MLDLFSLMHSLAFLGFEYKWLMKHLDNHVFEKATEDIAEDVFLNTGLVHTLHGSLAKHVHEVDEPAIFVMEYINGRRAIPYEPKNGNGQAGIQNMLEWSAKWHYPAEASVVSFFVPPLDTGGKKQ